jgi:hypothetical protein
MRCQWHRMHENFLLGSPLKFIYFFRGVVGQFGNMFLIDIPFKGCQGCSNRSSTLQAVSYGILHSIAVLHMIFTFRIVRKIDCACGVNDTACTCASCVNDTTCILKNSNIFTNSNLYSKKL